MHELTADDLPAAALDPDLTVWVRLPPRYKAGKPSHRFKYEQQRVHEIGGSYHPDAHAWTIPGAGQAPTPAHLPARAHPSRPIRRRHH